MALMESLMHLYGSLPPVKAAAQSFFRKFKPLPVLVNVEVTRLCNLACLDCYRKSPGSIAKIEGNIHLTPAIWEEMLDRLPSSLRMVNFLGEGEPLMNPQLDKLIEMNHARGIATVFPTNGMLVTKEQAEHWKKNGVFRVYVSLDSSESAMLGVLRRGAHLPRVLESLAHLRDAGIPVTVNALLYEQTIWRLGELIQLCHGYGVSEINPLIPVFQHDDLSGSFTRPSDDELHRTEIAQAGRILADYGMRWTAKPSLKPAIRQCNFPWQWPAITIEGDVYACCYAMGRGRTEFYHGASTPVPCQGYNMGNLFKTGFKYIWRGESYEKLRANLAKIEVQDTYFRRHGFTTGPEELAKGRTISGFADAFDHCAMCLWRYHVGC